jgi:hypothetical protein
MIIAVLVLLLLAGPTLAETAVRIYWTEYDYYHPDLCRVARARVDGTGMETVLDGYHEGVGAKDLAIDSESGKLYVADPAHDRLERSNLDGSSREDILLDVNPVGIALDVAGGKIYFADYTYSDPCIRRADLDGTNLETLAACTDGCVLEGIALDLAAGRMYWAERMDQQIYRANLDGSGAYRILECHDGVGHPRALVVTGGRVYWSTDESVYSATTDGEDMQLVIDGLDDTPYAMELDPEAGRLYWVTGNMYSGAMVQSANLDGTGLQTIVTGLDGTYGLALEFGDAVPAPDLASPGLMLTNYPNPFNPLTSIRFELPSAGPATVTIHALDGTLIGTLVAGPLAAGRHEVRWDGRAGDGRALSSGVYLCRLSVSGGLETRLLTLIR